ncbi:MAG: TIM barrel protein [Clostridiales bacterium]|nr:TIM barrel protein [Clostridiales bacterium]
MKISVCIDALYNGKDFVSSMRELHENNINSFEFWSWWDKDIDNIVKVKKQLKMKITAFCTKFVSLTDDTKLDEYIKGLKESIVIAKKCGCNTLITQVGDELTNTSRYQQHRNIVSGLKACVPILKKANITLVFEPLNILVDHEGYYLYGSTEAFLIESKVNSPNVKVLYDVYHQQITEGNIIDTITKNIDKIGHFHGAGIPGRHELLSGELNYLNIISEIDKMKFKGYMGLEYFPINEPLKGIIELNKSI